MAMNSPATYLLLALNIGIFLLQAGVSDRVIAPFALWPLGQGFEFWQLFTGAFLHASLAHLATNMFGLWMFGRDVETRLGTPRFAALYLIAVLSASLAQLAVTAMMGSRYPTVGASGGLFGVLAAFALLFPKRIIVLLIPPVPLPAPLFVFGYAAFELYAGVTGTQQGVAHFAHLGGLAGGLWAVRHWRRGDAARR